MIEERLRELGAPRILRVAAQAGLIQSLECAMPECWCPEGRGYFEATGHRSPWAPTPDRWPLPGLHGGTYAPSNVRLAHARCNYSNGARLGHQRLIDSGWYGSDRQRAVSRAVMKSHHARWHGTPEAQAWASKAGQARAETMTSESQAEAGRASHRLLRETWFKTPEAAEHWRTNGLRSTCKRWNVNRGKPCTCGHHDTGSVEA